MLLYFNMQIGNFPKTFQAKPKLLKSGAKHSCGPCGVPQDVQPKAPHPCSAVQPGQAAKPLWAASVQSASANLPQSLIF